MMSYDGFLKMLRKVWADESGFVVSAELVLVSTLLGVGMIAGLTSLRNQVAQELTDVGQAIGSISQSYAYGGICKPYMAYTDGSCYNDKTDFCQEPCQTPGCEPGGLIIRDNYPACAPICPRNCEQCECRGISILRMPECGCETAESTGQPTPAAWVFTALEGYPANVVRADVLGKPTLCCEVGDKDPAAKVCSLSYQLSIAVDEAKYDRFQRQLVQQLEGVAIRKGPWVAGTDEQLKSSVPVQAGSLPSGSHYEGIRQIRPDQRFAAGAWGTDRADLGKETIVVVNTQRDTPGGPAAWQWFNIRRPDNTVRTGVQVKVEYLAAGGKVIGQELLPVNLGQNASPPGLEVFNVVDRHDSDMRTLRTLGAKNSQATDAAVRSRTQSPVHHAEDLLVMVSPYIALTAGGDPPQSFATNVVVPMTKRLTRDEAKQLQDIRCSVVAYAGLK